jgi:hypothetical protein
MAIRNAHGLTRRENRDKATVTIQLDALPKPDDFIRSREALILPYTGREIFFHSPYLALEPWCTVMIHIFEGASSSTSCLSRCSPLIGQDYSDESSDPSIIIGKINCSMGQRDYDINAVSLISTLPPLRAIRQWEGVTRSAYSAWYRVEERPRSWALPFSGMHTMSTICELGNCGVCSWSGYKRSNGRVEVIPGMD